MKKLFVLFAHIVGLCFFQGCSSTAREVSEPVLTGALVGEPESEVKSKDGKFLCDFQWTKGAEAWDYSDASGDKAVGDANVATEAWCLVPYGESTELSVLIKKPLGVAEYVCRDATAEYSLQNETDVSVPEGVHTTMKCVKMSADANGASIDVNVTAGANPQNNPAYVDTKLYHVSEMEGRYSIGGHINLKLVRKKSLRVLFEPIYNVTNYTVGQAFAQSRQELYREWNDYLGKVGYAVEVDFLPIFFPSELEKPKTKDLMLTIPEEKDVLELFPKIVEYYNKGLSLIDKKITGLAEYQVQEWDYLMAFTPAYSVTLDVVGKFSPGRSCPSGSESSCIEVPASCTFEYAIGQSIDILTQFISGDLPGTTDLSLDVYNAGGGKFADGAYPLIQYSSYPQAICTSASYGIMKVVNTKAHSFSLRKGTLVVDAEFNARKNQGRLLAGALYAKILGRNPFSAKDDGLWFSAYEDNAIVVQPSKDWNIR